MRRCMTSTIHRTTLAKAVPHSATTIFSERTHESSHPYIHATSGIDFDWTTDTPLSSTKIHEMQL